jgi:hypothetical protein
MDIKPRLKIAILSGVFCAAVGSLLGGIAVVVLRVVRSAPGDSATSFVSFIPVAVLFAAIQAVPFGLIIGAIGGWWLVPRLAGDTQPQHIFLQSAVMGAILGSTFPILAIALGWGPLQNLVSVLPISIGIGIVCGLSLTVLMRKFLPPKS